MNKKEEKRIRLKKKIRSKIFGTSKCPRLSVFRSNKYIYGQIIDDEKGVTIVSTSDLKFDKGTKTERSNKAGTEISKLAIAKGIKKCVFDRNGFRYIGRIKAFAEAARKAGLSF